VVVREVSELNENERKHVKRQIRRLRFAAGDMRQAEAAIRALLATTEEDDVNLMLALETSIAVCYGRPFTDNQGVGQLARKWAPDDPGARSLHDQLLVSRKKAYAHTDEDSGRDVIDRSELYDDGLKGFEESWLAMDREVLAAVAANGRRQEDRFQTAASELVRRLQS
jgi:hypothetical protein